MLQHAPTLAIPPLGAPPDTFFSRRQFGPSSSSSSYQKSRYSRERASESLTSLLSRIGECDPGSRICQLRYQDEMWAKDQRRWLRGANETRVCVRVERFDRPPTE